MNVERKLGRLWRTARPLRREQLLGRLVHELRQRAFRRVPKLLPLCLGRASPVPVALCLRPLAGQDDRLATARQMAASGRALLAGHEVPVRAWADPLLPKLVRYHLHYLDAARELAWAGSVLRSPELQDHAQVLIADWSQENPLQGSEGWEPYPVAARLQNLAHVAALSGPSTPEWMRALMVLHARYLNAWPETHLQANHLLKDWVALALAGLALSGSEADAWRARGLQEVRRELIEQVLPDGGHYERSPMYHLLVLSDLLDIRDFSRARGERLEWLETSIEQMAQFAANILHPDEDIPLFNDSVLGQAPRPSEVFSRLDSAPRKAREPVHDAPHFGLTVMRGSPGEVLILDTGPLGPEHQPGHAHSDTLSYELSVAGERCVVNSGMDGYQSRLRPYFRSAAAHNTITVDGQGPDELWSAFRVGGRCRVLERRVLETKQALLVSAALEAFHGWKQRRTIVLLSGKALLVLDEVEGAPPGAEVVSRARVTQGDRVCFKPLWGTEAEACSAPYAPRFGATEMVTERAVRAAGPRARLGYALLWGTPHVSVEMTDVALHIGFDGQQLQVARP